MSVHRIAVRETNCYLLQGTGGTVLIDPGPPGVTPAIIAGAGAAGVHSEDVQLILVTHGHLDHIGAAEQAILTATDPTMFTASFLAQATQMEVADGRITWDSPSEESE